MDPILFAASFRGELLQEPEGRQWLLTPEEYELLKAGGRAVGFTPQLMRKITLFLAPPAESDGD